MKYDNKWNKISVDCIVSFFESTLFLNMYVEELDYLKMLTSCKSVFGVEMDCTGITL